MIFQCNILKNQIGELQTAGQLPVFVNKVLVVVVIMVVQGLLKILQHSRKIQTLPSGVLKFMNLGPHAAYELESVCDQQLRRELGISMSPMGESSTAL